MPYIKLNSLVQFLYVSSMAAYVQTPLMYYWCTETDYSVTGRNKKIAGALVSTSRIIVQTSCELNLTGLFSCLSYGYTMELRNDIQALSAVSHGLSHDGSR